MGNAADRRLFELAEAHAQHPEPLVRSALAHAMRFLPGPGADLRLVLARDPSEPNRLAALMRMAQGPLSAADRDALRVAARDDASSRVRERAAALHDGR